MTAVNQCDVYNESIHHQQLGTRQLITSSGHSVIKFVKSDHQNLIIYDLVYQYVYNINGS